MSFLDSMQRRYTTKKFDPSKKIDSRHITALKTILQLSPSSTNSQPWKFSFISDDEIKQKLSEVSWLNTNKVLDCDQVIVFSRINNITLFEEQIKGRLPKGSLDYYQKFIKPQTEEQIKTWFEKQVYLAMGIFLSACAEMSIDATPMEGLEPEKYDKILNHKEYTTLAAVAIGYRDIEDFNHPSKNPKSRISLECVIATI